MAVLIVLGQWPGDGQPSTMVPLVSTTAPSSQPTTGTAPTTTEERGTAPPIDHGQEIAPGWALLDGGPLPPGSQLGAMAWTGRDLVVGTATDGEAVADAAAYDAVSGRWRRIAPPPIPFTSDAVAVWTGDEVVAFTTGGQAAYDPQENAWRELAPRPEETRHPVGAVWTGSEVVLIAHIQDQPRLLDRLSATAYDPATSSWRRLPEPPMEMSYASTSWHDGRVVLVGGFLDVNNRPRSEDGSATAQAYDVAGDSWQALDGLELSPNAVTASATPEGILAWDYLLQARLLAGDDVWTEAPSLPLEPGECYPGAAPVEGSTLAWFCGQAALYLSEADTWAEILTPPTGDSQERVPDELVAAGDHVFFWGGDPSGSAGPFLWRFDPERAVAAELAPVDVGNGWAFAAMPELRWRTEPSLVWTGEELIVWGGHGMREEVYDGVAYTPGTGVSRRLPPAPHPGRSGQAATWSGEEMYVWHGPISAWSPQEAGWRVLPEPPSVAGAVPAGTAAVWSGTEVLLTGGSGNTGAGGVAYDPATETYRTLAPSPVAERVAAVHAWSGRELYLWGGGGSHELVAWYQDGAAYDPIDDRWRLLPELAEELHMSGPVGVWSGDELLVVGVARTGSANELPHLAGVAYSPVTDGWRSLTSLPLSVFRNDGLAGSLRSVWAGDRMAVWLPAPHFGETPQLGFYDPATHRWGLSQHLPFDARAWGMAYTGEQVAVVTDSGLLLYEHS